MIYDGIIGVPRFSCEEFTEKKSKYCILIPIINEHGRIEIELERASKFGIDQLCDIVICDGGSNDDSTAPEILKKLGVNTLLVKKGAGKQGAQLRMGFWWALKRGYEGFVTIDGNNKDSIEDVPQFLRSLEDGYDFIQGSRFIEGGNAINTPFSRLLAVKLLHAPIISLTAKHRFTDSTNAFRAYSRKYIEDQRVQIFREVFSSYELLAYLSVRASQLGLSVCEVPVTRAYPDGEKVPTKINGIKGNLNLLMILLRNLMGKYNP
ncbi:MAG: glycosyl transferase family 2 [Firmicutes bacterium HGW-Firmicutes-2]|jgi:dolichol-phosphate mannosyltransferase|nr:MAG: glycosyl transferase family 2 [Firmicutes bacterium HGW-Firmicutes-2]